LIHLAQVRKDKPRAKRGVFDWKEIKDHRRESSDNPMLNAFCRVAPSVRFSAFAILPAGIFFFAINFNVLMFCVVHARRLFLLGIYKPPW
jgi:hypothetical protein